MPPNNNRSHQPLSQPRHQPKPFKAPLSRVIPTMYTPWPVDQLILGCQPLDSATGVPPASILLAPVQYRLHRINSPTTPVANTFRLLNTQRTTQFLHLQFLLPVSISYQQNWRRLPGPISDRPTFTVQSTQRIPDQVLFNVLRRRRLKFWFPPNNRWHRTWS